jgi:hypothetical protein
VSGGDRNLASGAAASVGGGDANEASGSEASVSGGLLRTAGDDNDWAAGSPFEDL